MGHVVIMFELMAYQMLTLKLGIGVGYIHKMIYLFDDSIKRNVAFGVNDDIDEKNVWKCLRQEKFKEFVKFRDNILLLVKMALFCRRSETKIGYS